MCPILRKFRFCRQIFIEVANAKFHENKSIWNRTDTCGQTDRRKDGNLDRRKEMTEIMGTFRKIAVGPKMK
jgi:hypothetical protein